MTEAAWVACTDPWMMLDFLRHQAGDRKFRLFCVACCRLIWPLLTNARSRKCVETAEAFADGLVNSEKLEWAKSGASWIAHDLEQMKWPGPQGKRWAVTGAAQAAASSAWWGPESGSALSSDVVGIAASEFAANVAGLTAGALKTDSEAREEVGEIVWEEQRGHQAAALRCIFGSPFCAVAADPVWLAWNSGTLVQLAQSIYEERRFNDLPVLADALEEAGCMDNAFLDHCRQPGDHYRGCWVVDLLLGKK